MTEFIPVGTRWFDLPSPFPMKRSGSLLHARVAYETWGTLDAEGGNAILIVTGLSPDAHAARNEADPQAGWWEPMLGPGKPIDTDRWFVVCVNSLGSCKGSTGPASTNPATGATYRLDFPDLSIEDGADAAAHVVRALGIAHLACVIGNSMGGMTALSLLARHAGIARSHINISGAARALPFSIAIRSLQREAVLTNRRWRIAAADRRGIVGDELIGGVERPHRALADINFDARNLRIQFAAAIGDNDLRASLAEVDAGIECPQQVVIHVKFLGDRLLGGFVAHVLKLRHGLQIARHIHEWACDVFSGQRVRHQCRSGIRLLQARQQRVVSNAGDRKAVRLLIGGHRLADVAAVIAIHHARREMRPIEQDLDAHHPRIEAGAIRRIGFQWGHALRRRLRIDARISVVWRWRSAFRDFDTFRPAFDALLKVVMLDLGLTLDTYIHPDKRAIALRDRAIESGRVRNFV